MNVNDVDVEVGNGGTTVKMSLFTGEGVYPESTYFLDAKATRKLFLALLEGTINGKPYIMGEADGS